MDSQTEEDIRKTVRNEPRRCNISIPLKEKEVWDDLHSYEKRYGKMSKGLRHIVKDKRFLEEKNKELTKQIEELKQRETYLNDCLSGKSEEEIYHKVTGLDYPDDCYDMLPVEGKPNLRICMCPPSQQSVQVSLVKGKYVVDDPHICGRCKALGYRKVKENSKSIVSKKPRLENPIRETQYNGDVASSSVVEYKICPMDGKKKHLANCDVCRIKAHNTWVNCQKMNLKIY